MDRLYQKEWFGIPFESFIRLDSKHIAGKDFYNKFYTEFYKKYSSYEDLPFEWRIKKDLIAGHILENTRTDSKVLSVGCGIGYIEQLLGAQERDVTAIEPSSSATHLMRKVRNVKVYHGYFPQCLPVNVGRFDLAYSVDTDYVFTQDQLIKLIEDLKKYCGETMFFSISSRFAFLEKLKKAVKYSASSVGLYRMGQFWGYLRTPADFKICFKQAGCSNFRFGYLSDNCYWVRGENE